MGSAEFIGVGNVDALALGVPSAVPGLTSAPLLAGATAAWGRALEGKLCMLEREPVDEFRCSTPPRAALSEEAGTIIMTGLVGVRFCAVVLATAIPLGGVLLVP
jgi:hypothetical protein